MKAEAVGTDAGGDEKLTFKFVWPNKKIDRLKNLIFFVVYIS